MQGVRRKGLTLSRLAPYALTKKEVVMSELKVVHIKDVKGERREPPRVSWILVSEKTVGAQNLAMGVNETYPGGMVPEHKHDERRGGHVFCGGAGNLCDRRQRDPS